MSKISSSGSLSKAQSIMHLQTGSPSLAYPMVELLGWGSEFSATTSTADHLQDCKNHQINCDRWSLQPTESQSTVVHPTSTSQLLNRQTRKCRTFNTRANGQRFLHAFNYGRKAPSLPTGKKPPKPTKEPKEFNKPTNQNTSVQMVCSGKRSVWPTAMTFQKNPREKKKAQTLHIAAAGPAGFGSVRFQ